jgi:AraC family transcriptional regulator, ethanolamine operon transcriptional activator
VDFLLWIKATCILNPQAHPASACRRTARQGDIGVDTLLHTPGWNFRQLSLDDTDELVGLFRYSNTELTRLSGAPGKTRFASGSIADLGFQATSMTGHIHVRGALPAGTVFMQFDRGSIGQRRYSGQPVGSNDVVIGRSGAEFDFLSAARYEGMAFTLPEPLVVAALCHREPAMEAPAQSARLQVATNGDPWVARIRGLMDAVLASCAQPGGPRAWEHAGADTSDALIAMLQLLWSRGDAAASRPVHYQRLPIVRRLTEFMRANLSEPLMMHDLCKAAHASERAVEYAFRDVCGMGPKQYLRMLRLNQVRRDLKTLPTDVATVTTIAHQYGFWHMGHFSNAYRQLFGETPRQTRQNRAG